MSMDLSTYDDEALRGLLADVQREMERRSTIANAQQIAEQQADAYAKAIAGKPASDYQPGTVVGPGEKVTENGVEYVNTSGAWLSVPPSAYPLGYQLTDPPKADEVAAWQPDTSYKAGQQVAYDGVVYVVVQDHRSQADWTPDAVASLYTKA